MKTPHKMGLLAALVLGAPMGARAQYVSGSDGTLGDLAPATTTTITVPTNGVLNYANVNIPSGVTVSFSRPANNTPIFLLATGDITITGTISVRGGDAAGNNNPYPTIQSTGGNGGPGGFRGGHRVVTGGTNYGLAGGGPWGSRCVTNGGGGASLVTAGGTYCAGANPTPAGAIDWLALAGGSGGASHTSYNAAGGGGGGVIVIASSGNITINGTVTAVGGNGSEYGGGGGGGVIRIAANNIAIGATALLDTRGGYAVYNGLNGDLNRQGGTGVVRLESFTITGNIAGKSFPNPYIVNPPQSALPPFGIAQLPKLTITKVGGQTPVGAMDAVPPNVTTMAGTPITVEVAANYVPVGTTVTILVRPATNNTSVITATSTPLAGTLDASTATATVTLPTTTRIGSIDAYIASLPVP